MNSATFSASAPATISTFPPTARDCSTSGGPRPCWPSWKPHDGTSPHVREHRLCLLARALTEPTHPADPVVTMMVTTDRSKVCSNEHPFAPDGKRLTIIPREQRPHRGTSLTS